MLFMGLRTVEIFFTLTVQGSTLVVRICRLYRRQILTTKVGPRAVWVKAIDVDMIDLFMLTTYSPYLIFHLLKVVSRYRDPQLQVDENYWYLIFWYLIFFSNIFKSSCLNTYLISKNFDLTLIKYTKHDYGRD